MMFALYFAVVAMVPVQLVSGSTVFAHFMLANSYSYTTSQWNTDMTSAKAMGIDGFALNFVPPDCQQPSLDWQVNRIDDAFQAAAQTGFSLIYSFDMSYTQCNILWNQTFMQDMIIKYSGSSAMYRWNNAVVVTTYGGEQYTQDFFQTLKDNNPDIVLAPAFTTFSTDAQTDPNGAASSFSQQWPFMDGFFNWQAWPRDVNSNITLDPDLAFQKVVKGPYIMAVSPWQFKDLDDGNSDDAWVEYSDYLFPSRFEQLVNQQIKPDIVELISWNDYPESHYIRDLPDPNNPSATDAVQLGNTGNYVWGSEHSGWRTMAQYYIEWYKTGSQPAVTEDLVVYWYRLHPKDAVCDNGSPSIRNHDFPADAVFAWALVQESSTISLSLGSNLNWTFQADGSGPVVGFVPFPSDLPDSGVYPQVQILRNGGVVQSAQGSQLVSAHCTWQNFNPVVGLVGPGLND